MVPTLSAETKNSTVATATLSSAADCSVYCVPSVTTSPSTGLTICATGGTVSLMVPTTTGVLLVCSPSESMATATMVKVRLPLPTGATKLPTKASGKPGMPAGANALSTRFPSTRKATEASGPCAEVALASILMGVPSKTTEPAVGLVMAMTGGCGATTGTVSGSDQPSRPLVSTARACTVSEEPTAELAAV